MPAKITHQSEDVHHPSGSSDMDSAAQDARRSIAPEALPPRTGARAYHRGSTALAPRGHGRLAASSSSSSSSSALNAAPQTPSSMNSSAQCSQT